MHLIYHFLNDEIETSGLFCSIESAAVTQTKKRNACKSRSK